MTEQGFANPIDAYPSGAITWLHGDLNDVPAGWFLCDGNNGTPNLLDRMLRSVPDGTTDPGATGGSDSITLTTTQLPSHDHTGSGSTDDPGSHQHEFKDTRNAGGSGFKSTPEASSDTETSFSSGSHSHTVDTVESVGSGNTINNVPSFVKLIPIQKG